MALPLLFMIGGTLVRAAGPTIAKELAKLGAKKLAGRAATEAAKKGTAKLINNSNLGVVRTLARPGAKAADKVDDLAAGVARTIGRGNKIKPPKPSATTTPKPSATAKPKPSTTAKPKTATGAGKPTMAKPKPTTKPSTTAKPKTRPTTPPPRPATGGPKSVVKPLLGTAGVAGTMLGVSTLGKDDKGKSKAMPLPKPKPKVQGPPPPTKTFKPSGPSTRGSQKRGATKPISAGPNTGFGPKGSIFPGNAEERAALMKMYGGTGAEAGKAAIAGKQGNLAAGKADYEAARIKRLKAASSMGDRKKGGSMKSYKKGGKIGMKKKPEVVARQMRGWGKARKPKR